MDINKVFDDPRVKMLEEDIALWNEHCRYNDEERHVIGHMLKLRSNVLWKLNEYDDDMKRLLTEFNNALRQACAELYRRVMQTYNDYVNRNDCIGAFEVEGKIFLGFNYPEFHPIQRKATREVWDALTQGFEPLYENGCAWPLRFSKEYPPLHSGTETFEKWIGMENESDNWNEGLDQEWSKDMHLVQPFHNLYEHCNFSLYDLIYVREFNLEVNVNSDENIKY
jgi:hypothetical protein